MELIPATEFTLQELADAYNETRIDYIIPMPMTVERLQSYIEVYDVDLGSSCAAADRGQILGIGMLGLRARRAWVTRLGVLPSGRRQGVGRAIMALSWTRPAGTAPGDVAGGHQATRPRTSIQQPRLCRDGG